MGRQSQTCRVCTKRSKDFVELEAIYVRKPQITYLEVYNICTQLSAEVDDELPSCLCSSCRNDLKSSYKFVEKARETDKRLREKLGVHRSTRKSRRIEKGDDNKSNSKLKTKSTSYPEHHGSDDAEPDFEEIKPEFINCTKDPLEDSDLEVNEKSEDEMDWVPDFDDMESDGFAEANAATEDDDDEDDKPLKQLIAKHKPKPAAAEHDKLNSNHNPDYDSSDVFNDLPEPADNESSQDEDDIFKDKMVEIVPHPPTTQEAQIFPQGRYMCKICKKTYFTAEGLKAHMNVHMPKKIKDKRIRGPNKKKSKNKKKTKNASDQEDDEEDDEGLKEKDGKEGETENKKEAISEVSIEAEGDGATTTESADVKKKRKIKPPKPKKMFPCSVCGKHMISASKLRYHMVMHTGEKDFLCTMCPKAYSTIYALKHHMRTHTGERPYECKFCGDKFTRPTTLKSHMRRHTGERPYGCDICGKRFIQHSSMTTHMKLNHMAKTIGCPHCDKKYARQTDLNTHLLSHTGDKPFSCSICPSRFIRQANLNKHMNQHHLAKNKTPKNQLARQQSLQLKTDEPLVEQSMAQDANSSQTIEQTSEYVEQSIDRVVGQTTIQFAGQPINSKMHSATGNNQMSEEKINTTAAGSVVDQFAGQVMQQKISASTTSSNKFGGHVMEQKINFSITTNNQYTPVQQRQQELNLSPLPKLVSVRSLARPMQKGRGGQETTSTASGSDESNSSNRFLPPAPLSSPTTASSQIRHQQQMQQQNNMLPPQPQQQRLPNNENSMPISMNIAGIPGGIPTHSMLGGSGGSVHIGQHGQMGSVEHLKGIHPPVDNLTNLLGQVIDPERIGRSVEEMIPWTWSNTS